MVASKSLIALIFVSLYVNWIIASPISQNRPKRQAGEDEGFGFEPEGEHEEDGQNDDFGEDNEGDEEGEHGGHHGEHGHEHGGHHEQSEERPRRGGASNHNEFNVKQEAEGGASVTITNRNN
ncbi:hypothetical protein DdX_03748 [Ditylenchus destructor]|uniref:Uncharacterized protein n=1 Tax=Ditylenchus destructor TaxID=166010 RepID=A0AAD4NAN2_9BILA|nr:hypothetical protein DdX_03748 [Ditylenchus destructor]